MARRPTARSLRALLALLALADLTACARDPAMERWEVAWMRTERRFEQGGNERALREFAMLRDAAVKPLDAQEMELRRARAFEREGDFAAAVRVYERIAAEGIRRMDRARAHLELGHMAEDHGFLDLAVRIYRRLVLTYPDLMPGLRGLMHLERLFGARGRAGIDAHLTWTREAYETLQHTELGDNLVYGAAREAYDRFRRTGDPAMARLAERLYLRVEREHPGSGMWWEALWDLSWLQHRQGLFHAEIETIRRIQRRKLGGGIFGDAGHTYFWVGQFRIARHQLLDLNDPLGAAESYAWFIERYPTSRWLDDAHFWQGCAYLRAGRPEAAEASFAGIAEAYAESKYLRRLDRARAEPRSEVCDPAAFTEEDW